MWRPATLCRGRATDRHSPVAARRNILNCYLYNLDRVSYVENSAELITGAAYNNTRNPLVAQFQFGGETITAINVHLTSRGGSDPLWGATQPPADAGDAARTAQAAGVKAYVNDHLADDPGLNVAIFGDWNGFSWEDAQTQLTDPGKGGVFTDLNSLLSPEERYSYLFEGNAQQLDHILVTGGLLNNAQYDAVHINSQVAGERGTDHDPQLAMFDFGTTATATAGARGGCWREHGVGRSGGDVCRMPMDYGHAYYAMVPSTDILPDCGAPARRIALVRRQRGHDRYHPAEPASGQARRRRPSRRRGSTARTARCARRSRPVATISSRGGIQRVVNALYIVPTLYMLQVYDRVVPTQGLQTLFF